MSKKIKRATEKESAVVESFETSMQKLEGIVRELEGGNLGLGDSLEKYEQGVRHLKQCYRLLEQAEKKVKLLTGVDAEGNPIMEDFDDEATTLEKRDRPRKTASQNPTRKVRQRGDVEQELPEPGSKHDIDDTGRLF